MAGVGPVLDVVYPSQTATASSSADPNDPVKGTPVGAEAGRGGISLAVQLCGPVLELAGRVKRRPIKVLLDSGSTGNFISE